MNHTKTHKRYEVKTSDSMKETMKVSMTQISLISFTNYTSITKIIKLSAGGT